jgi:hypothetical protein
MGQRQHDGTPKAGTGKKAGKKNSPSLPPLANLGALLLGLLQDLVDSCPRLLVIFELGHDVGGHLPLQESVTDARTYFSFAFKHTRATNHTPALPTRPATHLDRIAVVQVSHDRLEDGNFEGYIEVQQRESLLLCDRHVDFPVLLVFCLFCSHDSLLPFFVAPFELLLSLLLASWQFLTFSSIRSRSWNRSHCVDTGRSGRTSSDEHTHTQTSHPHPQQN